jgi:hypothetical protein
MKQPFIYGRPAKGKEFIGRKSELSTIFNRLANGESTAIVGEPHIGKTSLLLQVMNPENREYFLGTDGERLIFSFLDLLPVDSSFNSQVFWSQALEPLKEHAGNAAISRRLREAEESGYASRALERLFERLSENNCRLVLLLDEFDHLLKHPSFRESSFFALLRSLATHVGGLSLVTATRVTVAQMNEAGRGLLDTGSPFFNHFIPVLLKPFDDEEVKELLGRAGENLSPQDCAYISRFSGKHPFLLQAMAATLLEANGENRLAQAAGTFYERISSHFDDLWYAMDDYTRTTAIILSLVELGGMAQGKEFSFGEIERIQAFGPELRKLAERGLAEKVDSGWKFDWKHLLLWHGERWAISSEAFLWWARDVVIAGERRVVPYDDWLRRKGYLVLLTNEQWEGLIKTVRSLPGWATQGVVELIRTSLAGLWKTS